MDANNLKKIMEDIETNTTEKITKVCKQNNDINKSITIVHSIMSHSAKEFKTRVGRPMTYSEMRQMFG